MVFDPYKKLRWGGTFVKRYDNGITVELDNGVIYFATNDRIITDVSVTQEDVSSE